MASNVQALISFQGQSLGAQHLGHCLTSETARSAFAKCAQA